MVACKYIISFSTWALLASLAISPAMQIFSCSLTVKTTISKEMKIDNNLKFA